MTSLRERIVRTLLERAVQVGEVTVLDGGLVRAGQRVEPRLVYEAESGQAAAQQELPLQVMTGKAEMASPRFLEAPAAKLVAAQAADREEEARRAAQQVPA